MLLRSIGDQIAPGSYALHSRFCRAVNFTQGSRLLCLVDEEIGPGPLNAVVTGLDGSRCAPVVQVNEDVLICGGERLEFAAAERYCSEMPVRCSKPAILQRNLEVLRRTVLQDSSAESLAYLLDGSRRATLNGSFAQAAAARIQRGVAQLFGGELLGGISTLRGCGVGLTPAGDDYLGGVLIGFNFSASDATPVNSIDLMLQAALGENALSNAFLEMAAQGRVSARMKNLLTALLHDDADAVTIAARRLFAVGATSGADIAVGLLMALTVPKLSMPIPAVYRRAEVWP